MADKLTVSYYMQFVPAGERAAFLEACEQLARDLGVPVVSLLAIMYNESGLKPWAVNPDGGAGGLIGFMPFTAKALGTSVAELVKMSRLQQLKYVRKYYEQAGRKFKGIQDLYLYTFYPDAIGEPDHYVIGSERGFNYANRVGSSNTGFDLNKDRLITLGEMKRYMRSRWGDIIAQERKERVWRVVKWSAVVIGVLLFVLLVVLVFRNLARIK